MRIVHVWFGSYPDVNPDRDRRNALAQESWKREYDRPGIKWIPHEVTPRIMPRMSDDIGDPQPMPYLHDLIDAGWSARDDDEILFLTNADVGFCTGIADRIAETVGSHGAAHMRRKEIGANATQIPTDQQIIDAPEYCGMDGTIMTAKWWSENRQVIPPMVWGRYGWDSVLRNLIRWKGGAEIKNAIWHSEHAGLWNASVEVVYKNPANHHNRLLLWQWILTHGGSDADHLFADNELSYK